ncbi:1-deoxy-D-xylulose-5-phosphate synthase [Thioalkalivibrio sp. XN279]|uniref:1-deoxy-D-xylulose-5-phosphate synthase n=1 Tax=Thioalkalivibrio sp. XN279 TaxID=2714953 RepID=UPI001407BAB2|nr:1-deoxy-D-xylulose-5-phosphate synthase [Thioalkalivibrio sp. XN279]NHA15545.1 1-deoxy-D-xylulose-5-phosphate synthase [Thioalkalivibrio sp. XN279]
MGLEDKFPLLFSIQDPADLRALPEEALEAVTHELRSYLVETMAHTGGHFAANLGTVELATVLHYVFDTPHDRLVWDVGHQAYPHKILTGRRDRLSTIRQLGGLAPFPTRFESEYDTFGVGHSSTSVSAALGMAIAAKQKGERRRVVAVIGDGALTAGLAYEALCHAGSLDVDLLVILNDNDMSISENVGAMSHYLARVLSGKLYSQIREGSKKLIRRMPTVWELARRSEEHVKGMVLPGTLFEELGLNYIGPVDGHDTDVLLKTLRNVRDLPGPQFLHVVTRKGKGYAPAEADPILWHGPGPFDPEKGEIHKAPSKGKTYSAIFGDWLCDMAAADERVVGITPAMREGSGMVEYSRRFPERYFDVGICEQHAVTLGAGLACEGLRPVVAIYSSFLQRGYDQLIHDVALQNLPVVFALDRGGLVGNDGPTHHGAYDLSFLRCIPNMTVMAPADENECRQMLYTGITLDGPSAVRYPRGTGPGAPIEIEMKALPLGKAEVRRRGKGVALLAFGAMVPVAEQVAEKLDATVVNMRFVKPLDEDLVLTMARSHSALVTLEDNAVMGGAGSAVGECLAAHRVLVPLLNVGIPDHYIEHGSRGECLAAAGLDADSVLEALRAWRREPELRTVGES